MCRQTLGCDFERSTGASRSLKEKINDRATAQRRNLLNLTFRNISKSFRGVEQMHDLLRGKFTNAQQVFQIEVSVHCQLSVVSCQCPLSMSHKKSATDY